MFRGDVLLCIVLILLLSIYEAKVRFTSIHYQVFPVSNSTFVITFFLFGLFWGLLTISWMNWRTQKVSLTISHLWMGIPFHRDYIHRFISMDGTGGIHCWPLCLEKSPKRFRFFVNSIRRTSYSLHATLYTVLDVCVRWRITFSVDAAVCAVAVPEKKKIKKLIRPEFCLFAALYTSTSCSVSILVGEATEGFCTGLKTSLLRSKRN
jgi:hypothetical protein